MRTVCFLICLILAFKTDSYAQSGGPDPVRWVFHVVSSSDNVYEIRLTAHLESGWHIYAQVQPKEAISQPTKITFRLNPLVQLQGPVNERGKRGDLYGQDGGHNSVSVF